METKVVELLSEHFGMPASEINDSLEIRKDFNATELEIADFFQLIENAYSVTISKEDAASLHTVGDITSFITDHAEEVA